MTAVRTSKPNLSDLEYVRNIGCRTVCDLERKRTKFVGSNGCIPAEIQNYELNDSLFRENITNRKVALVRFRESGKTSMIVNQRRHRGIVTKLKLSATQARDVVVAIAHANDS